MHQFHRARAGRVNVSSVGASSDVGFPARIELTISGFLSVSRISRLMYAALTPSATAISAMEA